MSRLTRAPGRRSETNGIIIRIARTRASLLAAGHSKMQASYSQQPLCADFVTSLVRVGHRKSRRVCVYEHCLFKQMDTQSDSRVVTSTHHTPAVTGHVLVVSPKYLCRNFVSNYRVFNISLNELNCLTNCHAIFLHTKCDIYKQKDGRAPALP